MTTAVGDMETAYTDAAGRTLPDFTELGAGEIGGLTLVPGLYKWGTGVSIPTDVTLSGGPNDVWIFQIAGTLTQANATRVTLTGGALAKNVFWQASGAVAIGTTAHFEGIILAKTMIAMKTGASANGRLLAQTAVTLDQNTVTQPAQKKPAGPGQTTKFWVFFFLRRLLFCWGGYRVAALVRALPGSPRVSFFFRLGVFPSPGIRAPEMGRRASQTSCEMRDRADPHSPAGHQPGAVECSCTSPRPQTATPSSRVVCPARP